MHVMFGTKPVRVLSRNHGQGEMERREGLAEAGSTNNKSWGNLMNTFMKRLLPLVAISLFAAACGSEEASAPPSSEPTEQVSPAAPDAPSFAEIAMSPTPDRREQLREAAIANNAPILVYTTSADAVTVAAAFEEEYPELTVEIFRAGAAGTMINRVLTEFGAGSLRADVQVTNDFVTTVLSSAGVHQPFVSEFDAGFDPALRATNDSYQPNINYWMWVYNTDLVSEDELPRTYDDLLDPRWKDELVIARMTDWFYALWNLLGDDRAEEYFTRLGEQNPLLVSNFTEALNPIVAGERGLTITNVSGLVVARQDQGAPIKAYFPEEPTIARGSPIAIFGGGNNPEGGLLFAEFTLDPERGQLVLQSRNRVLGHSAVPPLVDGLMPEQFVGIDFADFLPNEDMWLSRLQATLAAR